MSAQDGDKFRDEVATLLAAKFRNVIKEFALTGKLADIFLLEPLFPVGQRKIAIECKAWKAKPLTSMSIAAIRSQYDPAFRENEIDALWIVTNTNIAGLPKRSTTPYGDSLQVFTFNDLQHSMMDFHDYLTSLINSFDERGLSAYYMETFTSDGRNLHDQVILPWLNSHSAPPLAIFGGYGIGKSSYASRLASWLAGTSLDNPGNRIPILIPLGGLTQAQDVRDLIALQFTVEHHVDGFNYRLFSRLNELGRFVILLDGFDEMKHGMRTRDIEANLRSVHQFVSPKSKVILFGRPDPFLTLEDELGFRGKNLLANKVVFDDPHRTEFDVHTIAMFDDRASFAFIDRYLKWNVNNNARQIHYDADFVEKRMSELKTLQINDLIRRPVHAKILADLALIPNQDIQIKNEYSLYNELIVRIAEREATEKRARHPISAAKRIDFMIEVAWWLWTSGKADSFSIFDVPETLAATAVGCFEEKTDRETALREMLIGSVLERTQIESIFASKDQIKFFFSHRSFWEFLVAEYIARLRFSSRELQVITDSPTREIVKFLRERPDRGFVAAMGEHLSQLMPILDINQLLVFSEMQNQDDINFRHRSLDRDGSITPVELVLYILGCAKHLDSSWRMIEAYVDRHLFRGNVLHDCLFLGALAWATTNGVVNLGIAVVLKTWQKLCVRIVLNTYNDWYDQLSDDERTAWTSSSKFPHANTLKDRIKRSSMVRRVLVKFGHDVSNSQFFAAGMIFAKAVVFRKSAIGDGQFLVKMNVSYIPDAVKSREAKAIMTSSSRSYSTHFTEVELSHYDNMLASKQDWLKLQQIVAHGKWVIDLSH